MSAKSAVIIRSTEETSISTEVVTAVAEATNTDPVNLAPLYDVIDPDALDGLFLGSKIGLSQPDGQVAFTFEGCEVVVEHDGTVIVNPPK